MNKSKKSFIIVKYNIALMILLSMLLYMFK